MTPEARGYDGERAQDSAACRTAADAVRPNRVAFFSMSCHSSSENRTDLARVRPLGGCFFFGRFAAGTRRP
jgi:hypothetical protein